ncbi:MAG TPA: 3-methyl-2-oxobutanoate dehydrogenase subunit VorB [bacterium]|nr:3-methyl-2-oxobutanoate dehydrogenase subunit VorB [bacterium]HPN95591.1 3-methyl-2-oxobutanoate dehydrogenase subunit VorB [bacterium]
MKNKEKRLMRGSEAIGEAAVRAGCACYFGYPITPQNELTEYMARRMMETGRVFLQSESEIAAINMSLGAASTGVRVMTSSSSPGISLKQEGISFIAAMELPCVIVNIVRGGPGLGNIAPAQSDYFQATRGGGHGDYRTIVLAPGSVQELYDLTRKSFELADEYRTPVLVLADGMLGQMMEPVVFNDKEILPEQLPDKPWTVKGAKDRPSRFIRSLLLDVDVEEEQNWRLYRKYQRIERREIRYEEYYMKGAELAIVAYGTAARIAKAAVKRCVEKNMRVGLIRPISLWPFPYEHIYKTAETVKHFMSFEMSTGQMVEDVQLGVKGRAEVLMYGRPGGVVPTPAELFRVISRAYNKIAREK